MKQLLPLVVILISVSVSRADNWPNWRGPTYNGICTEKNLPTEWDATKNIAWKLDLPGRGSSTPVVWGESIFLTCEDGDDVVLMRISTSGKEVWRKKLATAKLRARNDEGDAATASPSTDGKHVWAFIPAGDLACFDYEGNRVWHVNLQEKFGKFRIQFGMHSTPLLHGEHLYVATLHRGGEWIIAFEKTTGNVAWKIDRKGEGVSGTESPDTYSSPMLWKKGDKALLLIHGNDTASAHELADGKEVWRVSDLNPAGRGDWRFVSCPGVSEELIVIPTCKNGPTAAIAPDATGTVKAGGSGEKWRLKVTTDVPTPVIHDGIVYICHENGNASAYDAKTGKPHYERQRIAPGRHRASPTYADGKIYMTSRSGVVTVIEAGPTFKVLATNKMGDEVNGSPAISNGRIYLHGFKALYAIGK